MILLDAVYINISGGKVLLDYLIDEFEKTNLSLFYLLDKRIEGKHPIIKSSNPVVYVQGKVIQRHKFYLKHKYKFKKILCFGNVPPTVKLDTIVYTYFHHKLFIKVPQNLKFLDRALLRVKIFFLKSILENTDYWIVQTSVIKEDFLKCFSLVKKEKVLIIPFYPSAISKDYSEIKRNKLRFVYVSTGFGYKNHIRLLEAFKLFYFQEKTGELHLTVNRKFEYLNSHIRYLRAQGLPVINHGYIKERGRLFLLYRSSKYCIFPSLDESFGLGIIEAIENGCLVIGANLPYMRAVCEPSLSFDPTDVVAIKKCFSIAVKSTLGTTRQLVFNEIDLLLSLFREN